MFVGKKSKIGSTIYQLKENGYAVFENYYNNNDTQKIKEKCIRVLDDLPAKELDTNDEIAVPSFNGSYKVSLYSYDQPKYIPF